MTLGRVRSDTGLNLRDKPNGEKKSVLHSDEVVEVLDEVRFLRVKTKSGALGYVHGDYIDELPDDRRVTASDVTEEHFPSPNFKQVSFHGEHFIGKEAKVDHDFVFALKRVDEYAEQCGIKIWVTSSTRNINEQVRGAIVPPASRSCHHVGHAIDMNIQHDGTLYNSKKLKKSNFVNLPDNVVAFIKLIRDDKELRWGGDFNREDPVHIDDNLFNTKKHTYLSKLDNRIDQLNA